MTGIMNNLSRLMGGQSIGPQDGVSNKNIVQKFASSVKNFFFPQAKAVKQEISPEKPTMSKADQHAMFAKMKLDTTERQRFELQGSGTSLYHATMDLYAKGYSEEEVSSFVDFVRNPNRYSS